MPFQLNTAIGNGIRTAGGTPASSVEGLATNFLQGAVSGIPIVGGLASGLVGLAGGLLGGNNAPEARGGNLYDGLQKPGAGLLNANDLTYGDAKVFADVARANNIYVQDVNELIAFDLEHNTNTWMQAVNWFRDHQDMTSRISEYNRAHPNTPILPRSSSPVEPISTAQQLTGSTATQPFVPQQAATNPTQPAKDKTTPYALIGGGAFLAIILLVLILKK